MSAQEISIIKKAQQGDMQAFEELLVKYDRHVMNLAYSFRRNSEDAKDIYQEVFMRIFRGIKSFKFNSEFSTWLYRITANVCISYHNKMKRHTHESLDKSFSYGDEDSTKLSDLIEGNSETDSALIGKDFGLHINKALEELPPKQKLAFTLKFYEGYKIREIAEIMECTDGTIKRYLFTATNKMREKLQGIMEE